MKEVQARIEKALAKLKRAGVKVSSYTVYPAKGSVKANVTIEVKGGKNG